MGSPAPLQGLTRIRGRVLIDAFVKSSLVQWCAPPNVISMVVVTKLMFLLFELGPLCGRLSLKR